LKCSIEPKIKKEDNAFLLSSECSTPSPLTHSYKRNPSFFFLGLPVLFAAGIETLLISSSMGARVEPIFLLMAKKA